MFGLTVNFSLWVVSGGGWWGSETGGGGGGEGTCCGRRGETHKKLVPQPSAEARPVLKHSHQ